jgi:hypothetical protein
MGQAACSATTTACTTDADCFNGQACVGKTCQAQLATCSSDADCPSGQLCAVAGSHTCLTSTGLTCSQVEAMEGWRYSICELAVPPYVPSIQPAPQPVCQGVGVTTADCNHCCECYIDTDCGAGYACLLDTHRCAQLSTLTCAQFGAHQGWSAAICQGPGESECGDSGDATADCDHCCECEGGSDCQAGTLCLPDVHLCNDALELTCSELATASGWTNFACPYPGTSSACSTIGRQTTDCTFCCCVGADCGSAEPG